MLRMDGWMDGSPRRASEQEEQVFNTEVEFLFISGAPFGCHKYVRRQRRAPGSGRAWQSVYLDYTLSAHRLSSRRQDMIEAE